MTKRFFTPAQHKALLWLKPGQACDQAPPRDVAAALKSLRYQHPDLVISGWKKPSQGKRFKNYELTEIGVAEHITAKDS